MVKVHHLSGSTGHDRTIKKSHLDGCKRRKCPICEKYYIKDNLEKVGAHVRWKKSAYIATTCRQCNSKNSKDPFNVKKCNLTYVTADLSKYFIDCDHYQQKGFIIMV